MIYKSKPLSKFAYLFVLLGLGASICTSILTVGCMSYHRNNTAQIDETPMYTFGDANYERQLQEGRPPVKHGPIAVTEVPSNFPVKFLESDGSYAGGRVYKTISEAQRAILEAKSSGMISEKGDWGIYQLNGKWDEFAYEHKPGEWHLKQSTTVAKRVY